MKTKRDPYKSLAILIDDNLTLMGASVRDGTAAAFLSIDWLSPLVWTDSVAHMIKDSMIEQKASLRRSDPIPSDLPRPYEGACLFASEYAAGSLQLCLTEEVPASRLKLAYMGGVCGRPQGRVIRLTCFRIKKSGVFNPFTTYHVWSREARAWTPLSGKLQNTTSRTRITGCGSRRYDYTTSDLAGGYSLVSTCMASEQYRREFWVVQLYPAGCPVSLSVLTTPSDVLSMLKHRDKREHETRRAAIIHWVRQHKRVLSHDPEHATEVRRHLRGSRGEFHWYGLVVKVKERDEVVG